MSQHLNSLPNELRKFNQTIQIHFIVKNGKSIVKNHEELFYIVTKEEGIFSITSIVDQYQYSQYM